MSLNKPKEPKWMEISLIDLTSIDEPKWVESQNESKWAQMTLNIFEMILYKLKIGLNDSYPV